MLANIEELILNSASTAMYWFDEDLNPSEGWKWLSWIREQCRTVDPEFRTAFDRVEPIFEEIERLS